MNCNKNTILLLVVIAVVAISIVSTHQRLSSIMHVIKEYHPILVLNNKNLISSPSSPSEVHSCRPRFPFLTHDDQVNDLIKKWIKEKCLLDETTNAMFLSKSWNALT